MSYIQNVAVETYITITTYWCLQIIFNALS